MTHILGAILDLNQGAKQRRPAHVSPPTTIMALQRSKPFSFRHTRTEKKRSQKKPNPTRHLLPTTYYLLAVAFGIEKASSNSYYLATQGRGLKGIDHR
eukprot:scaffold1785_cov76-Amphora_coffeaeformis.AAC.1